MTDASPADEATFVPRSLGPYTIERELGAGAMGTVFRAIHIGLDRPVALKVLRPDALQDPDAVRRFLREGKNIARLEHPHIVAVYDAGEIAGIYYLAMKLLEGETLQSLLAHSGPLTTDRVVRLASQLAAALHYAHGRGVIHRDVKPANVIVAENDVTPSIANFSIFENGYLLVPDRRSSRSYSTAVWANPAQLTMPRKKRWRSRERLSTSTTRRLIKRKSPASTGIETFVSRRIKR